VRSLRRIYGFFCCAGKRVWGVEPGQPEAEFLHSYKHIFDEAHSLPNDRLPRLRSVKLTAFPSGFLFHRPLPLVTYLTHLQLSAAYNSYSLAKLHVLLSANIRLESLSVGPGFNSAQDVEKTDSRVHLPYLRSVSLHSISSWDWALGIIQMVDAPAVDCLKLSATPIVLREDMFPGIFRYIATGRSEVWLILRNPRDTYPLPKRPIYPALEHLDHYGLETVTFTDPEIAIEFYQLFDG
jgi:hypothetical protein